MTILTKAAIPSMLLIGLIQCLPIEALANCACLTTSSMSSPHAEDMCWLTRGQTPEQIDEGCPILHHIGCGD